MTCVTTPRALRRTVAVILTGVLLAGCSVTPVYERPEVAMSDAWESAPTRVTGPGASVDTEWWKRFGSTELEALMAAALAANNDLAVAVERIEQARARVRGARAGLLPVLAGGTDLAARYTSGSGTGNDAGAALSLAWEVDLFGGAGATVGAAEAGLAASRYERESVALALQADVATAYFQALAFHERIAIAERSLATARELLRLVQVRVDNGGATELELAQQRTTLYGIESELPALRQGLRETQNALAILLGRAPQGFAVEGRSLAPLTLPSVDPGQPAALLERRPDIRAAEARLVAANADLGAARAALFPDLTLDAGMTMSGLLSGGTTTLASLAASLAQTLFDGGAREAQVQLSESQRRELALDYTQTVLVALGEVENGLGAIASNRERAALLASTAGQARESYRLASVRYGNGAEDLLTLLDSQRSQLGAEDSLAQAEFARYEATATLFRALGGGWFVDGENAAALPALVAVTR